jgi:tetratricopeptide (TPR) repeat protein
MHLQRGLLDLSRNQAEEALAHYRDAERELSGWWLIDEHIAEALALLGRTNEAITLYESVVERNARPEFLAALAKLYAQRGEADRARACRQRARIVWQPWRERFPEVVQGHSHDHAS